MARGDEEVATNQRSEQLFNGTPLPLGPTSPHPYAAFLTMHYAGFPETLRCTGTLVAPNKVLSATHCTVCAVSVDVQLVADTNTTIVVPAAGISHNPAALTDDIDCDVDTKDKFFKELNTKVSFPDDVAIVHLPAPSSVKPASVMLHPPFGFSPIKELWNQPVTLIGRGLPEPDSTDASIMRYGESFIDRYGPKKEGVLGMFTNQDQSFVIETYYRPEEHPGEAQTLGGDSGGPMIATVAGAPRVIGVASAGNENVFGWHATTFLASNSAYLWTQLYGSSGSYEDSDGDGVIDRLDNCPFDANTDQMDRDGDGWGDICDNCSPMAPTAGLGSFVNEHYLTDFGESDAAIDYSPYYNPSQSNCNQDAEDELLLSSFPDRQKWGMPEGISNTEYRTSVLPWLEGTSAYWAKRTWLVQGDQCDPVPCASAEATLVAIANPNPDFPELCKGPGFGLGPCTYSAPGAIQLTPTTKTPAEMNDGKVGLRYCQCALMHDTEARRRANCSRPHMAGCAIDSARFDVSDANWLTMSLNGKPPASETGVDELIDVRFAPGAPSPKVAWNSLADAQRLTGSNFLSGILWSHVPELHGTPTTSISVTGEDRTVAETASHYRGLDVDIRKSGPSGPFGEIPADNCWPKCLPPVLIPWDDYCTVCQFNLDLPWLTRVQGPEVWEEYAVTHRGDQLVTDMISPLVSRSIADGALLVPASEPKHRLAQRLVRPSGWLIDPVARKVVGTVTVENGMLRDRTREEWWMPSSSSEVMETEIGMKSAPQSLAKANEVATYSYSALRQELYVLRWDGARAMLGVLSSGGDWTETTLDSKKLGEPLASLYGWREHVLYAIVREGNSRSTPRLVRIDLSNGKVTVLTNVSHGGGRVRAAMVYGLEDELVLALSQESPPRLRMVQLRAQLDQVEAVGCAERRGELAAGDIAANARGIHYLQEAGRVFRPRVLAWSELGPCETQ